MRTFLLSLALFVSAICAAQVPSVTVENAKGEAFNTKTLLAEGTPMIISFWSTSCKPCIRELDAVYDALPDWLEEAEFRVVAVSTDDSRLMAKAKSFGTNIGRCAKSIIRRACVGLWIMIANVREESLSAIVSR